MGYGNIVMFAFREFFVEVIGKSLVPYTDIDSSISLLVVLFYLNLISFGGE